MDNNKIQKDELKKLKVIMFEKNGNMIRGNFSIYDIINIMNQKNDYKTLASYDVINSKTAENLDTNTSNDRTGSRQFYTDTLKHQLDGENNMELPSLILVMPKDYN